jgi:hypothetical protein
LFVRKVPGLCDFGMATVEDYVAMYPTLDRCIVEELVSALSNPDDIIEQLDEMQQLAIQQEEDESAAAGGSGAAARSLLARQAEEEHAMRARLKSEFPRVDDDVISFVLSQCANNESTARRSLKTQEERASGLNFNSEGQTKPRCSSALDSCAERLREEFGVDEAVVAFVLQECANGNNSHQSSLVTLCSKYTRALTFENFR